MKSRKPPTLVLSDKSYVTLHQLMGALAFARLDWTEQSKIEREAQKVIESLRRMKGRR